MNKYYHFEKIDSTSTYLKKNYNNLDDYTFVSASYQTKGHGRNNRKWFGESNKDLMFSILIKDKELTSKYGCLSLASSVVIYEVLKELNIKNVSIKWPNDVFVNNKKIAGVLLEGISCGKGIEALIIGVGVNVNSTRFNRNMINEPTSINLELKKEVLLENIKKEIYKKFLTTFEEIKNNNYSYLKIVRENNYLKNKVVYAQINQIKVPVKVIDINDDNSLKIEKNGELINVYSGEISFHI